MTDETVDRGRVHIGDRMQFAGAMFSTTLTTLEGATLSSDANTLLSYGVTIDAAQDIRTGRRCHIASMVLIRDRDETGTAPVVLGDDVWLAHGAISQPDVTSGPLSVVSAGRVVRSSGPPYSLAQGDPATGTLRVGAPMSPAG